MGKKLLFAASTRSHILHFHLPYLQAFHRQGYAVHCACAGEGEIPFAEEVLLLPFEKKMGSPRNFRAAHALRKRVRKECYDAVIVHTSLAAFFTRLALFGLKKRPKLVNMAHGYLFDHETPALKRGILLLAERLMAPVTDLLLTMNAIDFAIAKKYRLGKAVFNIPGVGVVFSRLEAQRDDALRQRLQIGPDKFVLLYPAEFSSRKSQEILLRAMTMLPERAVLVLPGDGALLPACKSLAQELGIAHRVIFPGYVSAMGPWYKMADCAVSSSRSEGLPFNIMEAMHCALPVVASHVKGHTDLIRQEENGILYDYGDWAACARAVGRIMEDRALAEALGRQAAADSGQYSLEQVLPQVMAQYETVLQ